MVVSSNPDAARPADEFVLLCKILMAARGKSADAIAYAQQFKATERIRDIVAKAVAGSLADEGWAAELAPYRALSNAFGASMRTISMLDRINSDGAFMSAPMRTRIGTVYSFATASETDEGAAKTISEFTFTAPELAVKKCSATVVVTSDLAKLAIPGAVKLIGDELRKSVAHSSNTVFCSVVEASVGATVPATGPDFDAVSADLRSMLESVELGEASRPYWLLSVAAGKYLSTLAGASGYVFPELSPLGGSIVGFPALVSEAVPSDSIYLIDASQIAADLRIITLDSSDQALIDRQGGNSPTLDLWSKNMIALRAERFFAVQPLRSTGVAALTGASWGEVSSASA
jgi:HK97 family phage major capsid protein